MFKNVHTTGTRVATFSPSPQSGLSSGAGIRRLIFTNTANSTLDNKYVVGSGVSSSMSGPGIRSALIRRANNTATGQPVSCPGK
jgi:hypothetical protein